MADSCAADIQLHITNRNPDWQLCQIHAFRVYVYLKPQKVPEDEVRQRNGWKKNALVPRWIGMPAH